MRLPKKFKFSNCQINKLKRQNKFFPNMSIHQYIQFSPFRAFSRYLTKNLFRHLVVQNLDDKCKSSPIKIQLFFTKDQITMRRILLLSFVLALALTFTVEKNTQMTLFGPESSKLTSMLKSCSNSEVQTAYNAIGVCQTSSTSDTITCINNYMVSRLNERWNVFARGPSSSDAMAAWVYNDCSVILNNYGKFGRLYILWPAANYASGAVTQLIRHISEVSLIGDCLSSRVSAVYSAVSSCDISGNQNAATCIVNKLKDNLSEYWDAYSGNSDSAITVWYYNQCGLLFRNFGSYGRNYIVWKASSS